MHVTETFSSLQGEGLLVGTPSFFIRTSGCNLRCAWCDTPHTSWLPEGRRRPVDELVREAATAALRHVVITGGEPMLQREIGPLTAALAGAGHHITMETAGTVEADVVCDLLSLSPKLSSSDPTGPWRARHRARRTDLAPLCSLLERFPEHQLKVVVRDRDDVAELLGLLDELPPVEPCRVVLMPEGRTAAEVRRHGPEVASLCLEHGFRYTPRLHLDLFGAGRGV